MKQPPHIGITMGDPKGIGPEIIAKCWKALSAEDQRYCSIYGDKNVLEQAAALAGVTFPASALCVTSRSSSPLSSISENDAARIALAALDAALGDAREKKMTALVTAPLNKQRMHLILPRFNGHTHYLAQAAGIEDTVMMFAPPPQAKHLPHTRVGLVTTHLPLKEVSHSLTTERVLTTIGQTHAALQRYFSLPTPRIAVLGLNPHAGEQGTMGYEEREVIEPAIHTAQRQHIICAGPFPADAFFAQRENLTYDAVIAMYHDQGLIPMKLLYPHQAVNITLGLPFVRTAPGHGTAEDIAWRNRANPAGMIAALETAKSFIFQ